MSSNFIFLNDTEAVLDEIFAYTADKFGRPQARKYIGQLYAALDKAAETKMWRQFESDTGQKVPFIHAEHHYLYFRQLQDGRLGVIAILHERMDQIKRLKAFE